ncbi:MAG: hypothetical protein ABJA66_14305 [Actinomycetota bacterium]
MQEQELFQSYEVKNWDFSARIYKIVAVSAIVNILALLIVGQTSLLTTKGCDSPLVGKVCQVIDTLYVGTKILSTDKSMGEADYTKTELSPDDEITFVNVADKLYYPEGYFGQSNPELAMMDQPGTYLPTDVNGFPTNIPVIPNPTINGGGTSNLMSKPQQLPKNNKNAIVGGIPDLPFSMDTGNPNPTITRPKYQKKTPWNTSPLNNKSPKLPKLKPGELDAVNNPNQNSNNTVQPKATPTPETEDTPKEDKNGIFINKKPLKVFAAQAKTDVKNVKLDAPFTVVIAADLDYDKDGKTVVLKNPKPVKTDLQTPNDAQMAKLAQAAILAVGDSGWLGYLKTLGVKKVVFTLSQNDTEMTAKILGDQKDENTAKTNASGLNAFIQIGRSTTDGDEKVLLDQASTTAEGKSIILNFVIPKQIAQDLIQKKLKEAEDKKMETKKDGSTAQINENNPNTVK